MLVYKKYFAFSTSKKYFNNCIKRLKCLEVLLRTFGESVGTEPIIAPKHESTWAGTKFFPLSKKGTLARRKLSKIFRTKPRGLLPPHLRASPGSGSCQGSATASRRTRRGLDTSLPPRPFLRYVGNGEVCKPAITVRGYNRGLAQYRDRRFCQPRPPVWKSNAVLRFESLGCQ